MDRLVRLNRNPIQLDGYRTSLFSFPSFFLYVGKKTEGRQFDWVCVQINHRHRIMLQVFTVFQGKCIHYGSSCPRILQNFLILK